MPPVVAHAQTTHLVQPHTLHDLCQSTTVQQPQHLLSYQSLEVTNTTRQHKAAAAAAAVAAAAAAAGHVNRVQQL
jgi:hypothetical protein